ncbi:MAG TPA: hypothetical protein VL854_01820 [Nitrososphaeraceae archaeon]|jgi:hypothetical protein|nr:hypothetical protein [Nitrososphaeraceae archaeon]
MQQSRTWLALSIVAAAALLLVTDVQVMSYAQGPAVPAVPRYRDCTPGITLDPNANLKLENARQRAIKFIDAAINALSTPPFVGSTVDIALDRHFVTPTDAERATINDHYGDIRDTLRVGNYICNTSNICPSVDTQGAWAGITRDWNDDLIHICRAFFDSKLDINCRAIILIHEGSHDEGINTLLAGEMHAPNRGSADYPPGNRAPPAGVTTADRMDNPDAYAFFAAHIWRNTDTGRSCF